VFPLTRPGKPSKKKEERPLILLLFVHLLHASSSGRREEGKGENGAFRRFELGADRGGKKKRRGKERITVRTGAFHIEKLRHLWRKEREKRRKGKNHLPQVHSLAQVRAGRRKKGKEGREDRKNNTED